jgi:hypothetical protein
VLGPCAFLPLLRPCCAENAAMIEAVQPVCKFVQGEREASARGAGESMAARRGPPLSVTGGRAKRRFVICLGYVRPAL